MCGAQETSGQRSDAAAARALLRGGVSLGVAHGTCRRDSSSSKSEADGSQPVEDITSVPGKRLTTALTLGTVEERYRSGYGRGGSSKAQTPTRNYGSSMNSSPLAPSESQSATQGVCRRRARTADPSADHFAEDSTPLRFDASCGVQDEEESNSGDADRGRGVSDDRPQPFRTDDRGSYTDLGSASPRWDARPPSWGRAIERKMQRKTGFTDFPENLGLGLGLDCGDCRPLPPDTAGRRIFGDRLAGEPTAVKEAAVNPLPESGGSWEEVATRPDWRGGEGQGWFWGAPRNT